MAEWLVYNFGVFFVLSIKSLSLSLSFIHSLTHSLYPCTVQRLATRAQDKAHIQMDAHAKPVSRHEHFYYDCFIDKRHRVDLHVVYCLLLVTPCSIHLLLFMTLTLSAFENKEHQATSCFPLDVTLAAADQKPDQLTRV